MSSSQLGQPFLRKSTGVWMREQRRHARNDLAFAGGMAADIESLFE
jgi:hypothetical protein